MKLQFKSVVDLSFNLSPKYLPVIYGVQKTDAIPIFVDSDEADASKLTVVYAVCEGPIAGLFDIYIDGNSSICVDKADFDIRSVASPSVDLQCRGRMDRGDTFTGFSTATTVVQSSVGNLGYWSSYGSAFGGEGGAGSPYYEYVSFQQAENTSVSTVTSTTGIAS